MLKRCFGSLLVLSILWLGHSTLASLKPPIVKASSVLSKSNVKFVHEPGLPDLSAVLSSVNAVRSERGLPPLVADESLTMIAKARANDMREHRYYAHKSPQNTYYFDLMKAAGFSSDYNCENLDLAFSVDPEVYVGDWFKSRAGHKECLLDPRVSLAGYATVTLDIATDQNGSPMPSYVVVAIHSTELER